MVEWPLRTVYQVFGVTHMPKKQSSSKVSTLASKVLSGKTKPTPAQAKTLAASVLSQDEATGQNKKKKP